MINQEMSNDHILKELGHRARRARVAMNMEQSTVAAEAGISVSTLSRFEQGQGGNLQTLLQVMRVLRLLNRVDMLFDENDIDPIAKAKSKKTRRRVRNTGKAKPLEGNAQKRPVFKNAPTFNPSGTS